MISELDALRAQAAIDTKTLTEYRATIERIKALHVVEDTSARRPWCDSDKMLWPCPTIKALDTARHDRP